MYAKAVDDEAPLQETQAEIQYFNDHSEIATAKLVPNNLSLILGHKLFVEFHVKQDFKPSVLVRFTRPYLKIVAKYPDMRGKAEDYAYTWYKMVQHFIEQASEAWAEDSDDEPEEDDLAVEIKIPGATPPEGLFEAVKEFNRLDERQLSEEAHVEVVMQERCTRLRFYLRENPFVRDDNATQKPVADKD